VKKNSKPANHLSKMTPEEMENLCSGLSEDLYIEVVERQCCMEELTRRLQIADEALEKAHERNVTNDTTLDNVRMIFEDEDGNQTLWSPADCVECGTPIDEEGQDMKYTGLCRVDANKNRNTMERSSMEPILEAKVFN